MFTGIGLCYSQPWLEKLLTEQVPVWNSEKQRLGVLSTNGIPVSTVNHLLPEGSGNITEERVKITGELRWGGAPRNAVLEKEHG